MLIANDKGNITLSRRGYWLAVRPPSTSHGYPALVFDGQDRLHFHLTVFFRAALNRVAVSTARAYLYAILRYFTFLDEDYWQKGANLHWDDPPIRARQAIRDYLVQCLYCKTIEHRLGFEIVKLTQANRAEIRIVLSGLKLFYSIMRQEGYYAYASPMIDSVSAIIAEIQRDVPPDKTPRMPDSSGVGEPRHRKRLTDSYFKLEQEEWVPRIIDDEFLPQQVLDAGRRYGWSLREICVSRILFESGARISEVLGLRLEDWISRNALREANAFSKGSHGRRVKVIRFTPETAKLLHHYVDTERKVVDNKQGHTTEQYLQMLNSDQRILLLAPLFLSHRRTALTPQNFRERFWNPACLAAGLQVDPHQARHWYVTQMIRAIYESSDDKESVQAGLRSLIAYMNWKSGWETLKVYDHYFDNERHADTQERLHQRMYTDLQKTQEERPEGAPELDVEDPEFDFLRAMGGS